MNFQNAAKETFQILRSYDYVVVLYDDDGNQVYQPVDARRFFAKGENLLVSINDKGEDSIVKLILSKNTDISSIQGLADSLRAMASKYKMVFSLSKRDRVLEPKDFLDAMNEGFYGTSLSSYYDVGSVKLTLRHTHRLTENNQLQRSSNIENIYLNTGGGNRYEFPTNNVVAAKAMAQHLNNQGNWADNVGQLITKTAIDFANIHRPSTRTGVIGGELKESATPQSKIFETIYLDYPRGVQMLENAQKPRLNNKYEKELNEWVSSFDV
ncbi:MAG: hypothetical protein EOP45_22690, partial [Sphingobacteriaceae bacterium]